MNIVAILEGIISSVPEAVKLWQAVAPLIDKKLNISEQEQAAIEPMVSVAHAAVSTWHSALAAAVPPTKS